MPVFLEKYILPVAAALTVLVMVTNPMGLDWNQRISGGLILLFVAYFVAYTVHKSNQARRLPNLNPVHSSESQSRVEDLAGKSDEVRPPTYSNPPHSTRAQSRIEDLADKSNEARPLTNPNSIHNGNSAEVTYQDGSKEVHHQIFNAHAGDIVYARGVDAFHGTSLDLPRLKLDTIEGIAFVDMTAEERAMYPKNMDPKFIRKGSVTFRNGKTLEGVFLGVGMIRFDDAETHGDLITVNVSAVRFLRASEQTNAPAQTKATGQAHFSDGRQVPILSMGLLGWPAGIVPIQDLSDQKYSYSNSIGEAATHAIQNTEELPRVSLKGIKRIHFFIPTSEEQKEIDKSGLGCAGEKPKSHGFCTVRKVSLFFDGKEPLNEIFIILGSNKSPIAALGPKEEEYKLSRYDLSELSFEN
jgi:hypothetical protein